jgi:hypothetical protein
MAHRFRTVTQDAKAEPVPSDLVWEGFTPTRINRGAISVYISLCPYPIERRSHCLSSTTTGFAIQCRVPNVGGRSVVYKLRSTERLSSRARVPNSNKRPIHSQQNPNERQPQHAQVSPIRLTVPIYESVQSSLNKIETSNNRKVVKFLEFHSQSPIYEPSESSPNKIQMSNEHNILKFPRFHSRSPIYEPVQSSLNKIQASNNRIILKFLQFRSQSVISRRIHFIPNRIRMSNDSNILDLL